MITIHDLNARTYQQGWIDAEAKLDAIERMVNKERAHWQWHLRNCRRQKGDNDFLIILDRRVAMAQDIFDKIREIRSK